MRTTSVSLLVLALSLLTACGEQETPETTTDETTAEKTVERPAPATVNSGNTFDYTYKLGDAQYQTGQDYSINYTILEYTTNCDFSKLPIEEYLAPNEEQQLVKVKVEAKIASLRNVLCKEPLDGFGLVVGGEEVDRFTRFKDDFQKDNEPKCLKPNETQTFDVYFKVPMNADLSGAKMTLYTGSDEAPVEAPLNK